VCSQMCQSVLCHAYIPYVHLISFVNEKFLCILYCPGKAEASCSPLLQHLCEMQSAQLTVELLKYCDEYCCNTLYIHTLLLILRFYHGIFLLVPLHFLHQQSCAFPKLQSFVAVCEQINQEQFCHYPVRYILVNDYYLHAQLLSTPPYYLL